MHDAFYGMLVARMTLVWPCLLQVAKSPVAPIVSHHPTTYLHGLRSTWVQKEAAEHNALNTICAVLPRRLRLPSR